MKLGHTRKGHIPCTMMKMTIDSIQISSLSIVTYIRQKTSPLRMKLGHTRKGHIPCTTMKMTMDSIQISSLSIVTYIRQKTSPHRMKLGLTCKGHIPCTIMKMTIDSTGSSRKNVKSTSVCTGVNVHKKGFFWSVLG